MYLNEKRTVSIRKRNGAYTLSYNYYDQQGKRRQKTETCYSYEEAMDRKEMLEKDPGKSPSAQITFKEVAARFMQFHAEIRYKPNTLWRWTDAAMEERLRQGIDIPFADTCIHAEYEDVTTIRVVPASADIQEQMSVDCCGITCQCIHLPSAHSDDSIVVYVPEEKAIFIGDIYGDDLYNQGKRDLEKTRALYQALKALEFEIAVPGHSEPLLKEKLMEFLGQFIINA